MKRIALIISFLFFSGCSLFPNSDNSSGNISDYKDASLHQHIGELARQLFYGGNRLQLNETIAVGSFLPIHDLQGKDLPPGASLGQQIQESMVTLATQAGLNVIEFKTTQSLKLENNLDIMLSRDLSKINKNIGIDYFLTGTYVFDNGGLSINARLIDVTNSAVVAAATDVVPAYVAMNMASYQNSRKFPASHQLYHLK